MKNALIFPYDLSLENLVKNEFLLKEVAIVGLVSPPGFGCVGAKVEGAGKVFEVCDDIRNIEVGENIDILLMINGQRECEFEVLCKYVEEAAKNGVSIWNASVISDEEKSRICDLCINYQVSYKEVLDESVPESFYVYELPEINTPIVSIAGMGDHCNQFGLQMEIIKRLKEKSYRVSAVSCVSANIFDEIHPFPSYMIGNKTDERSKIYNYCNFIKKIEKEEKPDVIIIAIPGEILPLSRRRTGNFGITAYEIFNAITPDFMILSMYQDLYQDEYFEETNKLLSYRLNVKADCFYISRLSIDKFTINSVLPLRYIQNSIESNINLCKQYMYPVFPEGDYQGIVDLMVSTLESYSEISIF